MKTYQMTEEQKKIHDYAPYWEEVKEKIEFQKQSKPPTMKQAEEQAKRLKESLKEN